MNIGQLKHRLTLQKNTPVADGGGGFTQDWQDIADVFAQIDMLSGRLEARFDRKTPITTHRIIIPYRIDITAEMRLVRNDRVYQITGMRDPDGEQRWIEIMAVAANP